MLQALLFLLWTFESHVVVISRHAKKKFSHGILHENIMTLTTTVPIGGRNWSSISIPEYQNLPYNGKNLSCCCCCINSAPGLVVHTTRPVTGP
jgi:hypothetical protein